MKPKIKERLEAVHYVFELMEWWSKPKLYHLVDTKVSRQVAQQLADDEYL